MNYIIRKATFDDLADIYNLVMELAIYEKEPDAVTSTLKDYEEGFENLFFAHVVELDDKIIGMALYYWTYSTWKGKMLFLEDFIITKEYRRGGIGQELFDTVINVAQTQGAKLLKWEVLDWNKPAIDFYKKNNATILTDWYGGRLYF